METIENIYCGCAIDVMAGKWYKYDLSVEELYSILSIPVIDIDNHSQIIQVAGYWLTSPYTSTNYFQYDMLDTPIKLNYGYVMYSKNLDTCKEFIHKIKISNDEYIDRLKLLQHKIKEII